MTIANNFRRYSMIDRFIEHADRTLRTLNPGPLDGTSRNPAAAVEENELSEQELKVSAGYMRVNHTGEVCAQALYQGQALTARRGSVKEEMKRAADEEVDHLSWCSERLQELHSRESVLNPVWYGLSFAMGAGAGLISDKVSLGFVAAVEDQVCLHLESHLEKLPANDQKSRAIVTQMLEDEARHAHTALDAGGIRFPSPVKHLMTLSSKAMTKTSYWI